MCYQVETPRASPWHSALRVNKTPAEVKEDVKRRIEIFSKGGGFVFNQTHNILADVKPEKCYCNARNSL